MNACPTLATPPTNLADCLETDLFVVQGKLAGPLVSDPTRVEFGTVQPVGTPATQVVTIRDIDAAAVTLTPAAFAITGPSAGDFAVDSTNCATLGLDATCTVTVRFTPTEAGFRTAILSLAHNGGLHNPLLIPLEGVGQGNGSVSLTPAASIDFGNVHTGGTDPYAAPERVTVKNDSPAGGATVTIGKIALGGPNAGEFPLVSPGGAVPQCVTGAKLAPQQSCALDVAFAPARNGTRRAYLSIATDADLTTRNIELTGHGDQGLVRVGPIDPATKFPRWYQDKTGLKLENCLDGLPVCFAAPADLVAPDGEAFFFNANTQIDIPGGKLGLVLGVESAYAGPGTGQEVTFNRVRFFATGGLKSGTSYRVTHPYGVDIFVATDRGVKRPTGSEDIGCLLPAPGAPCSFTNEDDPVLTSRGGPFLTWDPNVAPAPPTGYIGDGNTPHRVTGSPYGTNVFRVQELNAEGKPFTGGLNVETADFVVQGKLLGPGAVVASPKGGQFSTPQQVTLAVSDAMGNADLVDNDGVKIYYTTDGTTPTTASPRYAAPITVNTSMTLKFFAVNARGGATKVASASYVLGALPVTVTANPPGGIYATAQMVTLTPSDPGATIYYTEDGSTPSTTLDMSEGIVPAPGSVKYVPGTAINVASSKTLKFIGVNSGGGLSPVGSADYSIGNDRSAVGPVEASDGFPRWYQDTTGLRLEKCFDPANCFAALPDTAQPLAFPGNYPDELFYWGAKSLMTSGAGGKASLILATEAAFVPGPRATPGQQITFNRIRIKASGLTPGATYRVVHPYGVETIVANSLGVILFTEDIGCAAAPCDFSAALDGRNTPWLRWDATDPAPPAGYIGGGAGVEHTVVGSPFNTNFFRIEGPNAGGSGVNSVQTNLFTVQGKLATAATATASPKGGLYNAAQTVTLTTTGGTIRYTTDGTTPTATTGTVYSGPLTIGSTTTLKFLAVDAAGNMSPVMTESYTITIPPTVTAPKQSLVESTITVAPTLANSTVPVQLAWVGSGNITKYELQESTNNGGTWTAVPLKNPTATSIQLDRRMGSPAAPLTYKYQVRACNSTSCGAWTAGALFNLVVFDNGATTNIGYSGSWQTAAVAGAYGGTVRFATAAGPRAALNKITFTVAGSAALVTTVGPDRGIATISIDGGPARTIDLYAPALATARIPLAAIENNISAGTHTIVFTVTGTKNVASTGTRVDVDAIVVIR